MKVTVYGTNICTKTLHDLSILWNKGCQVDFVNITGSIGLLRDFIQMREKDETFQAIRKDGRVGTPFFVLENGIKTHDLEQVLQYL